MPTAPDKLIASLLPPNPVWRSYSGGSVLRTFRGQPTTQDDHFPEDWLASAVRARNGANSQGPNEGLSYVQIGDAAASLIETLEAHPRFWWGVNAPSHSGTGVLWKLLDSSARLQFQAHPDATFARKNLNSSAGKTECWYILATRGDACVYLGFQHSPGRERWAAMIREQRIDEMLACFERIPVSPGDCFVVPAGTPHAIGAGIFMLELQEPTDWVVRCETSTTDGKPLPPEACFMGLDLEKCLDVFNYESVDVREVRRRWQQQPRALNQQATFCEEEIIAPQHHGFFRLNRLRGDGNATWAGRELTLLIALKGQGTLTAKGGHQCSVTAGQTWLLPGSVPEWSWSNGGGDWEILLAKTPRSHSS